MAGQPKRRAMVAELERRTREEFGEEGGTHLDYVEQWLESGRTLYSLAQSIGGTIGMQVMYATLKRHIDSIAADAGDRIIHARASGAHALVEQSIGISNGRMSQPIDAQRAKLRADTRLRVAALWNRDEFGQKPGVGVTINVNGLHLDALTHRPPQVAIVAAPLAITSDIDADYELVSDDVTTT